SSGSQTVAPSLRAPHARLIHAEILVDLVPQRGRHLLLAMGFAARHALMRTLVNRDLVRHAKSFTDAPLGKGTALIQAQQARPRRLSLHHNDDVLEALSKSCGNAAKGSGNQLVEIAGAHATRRPSGPGHATLRGATYPLVYAVPRPL